jgi:hypothetical protein
MRSKAEKIAECMAAMADMRRGIDAAQSIGWDAMVEANRSELSKAETRLARLWARK